MEEWITREGIAFSLDSADGFNRAADAFVTSMGGQIELLGFGEPLHGGEDFLLLRNRLFRRLVEAHGYCAIAVESSFPCGWAINEYLMGRGASAYEDVHEVGFSHGFGKLEANRELVEWMRGYNADAASRMKVRFYGFDAPTEMTGADSPRQLLWFALDYLESLGVAGVPERRRRMQSLIGDDAAWANPAASFDPAKSVGGSGEAAALRLEVEELFAEMGLRRPELVREDGRAGAYLEAVQHAIGARQLLNYHAEMARASDDRVARLLGIRDQTMADNLAYAVTRERGRGKVLAFAHNSHLKRGRAEWQWGSNLLAWWPAGAHISRMLGDRYAVIGGGLGSSEENGIPAPEAGTLEAGLIAASPGAGTFIPTHLGRTFSPEVVGALPTRSGGRNPSYFPYTPQSFADFDGLAVLPTTTYTRGGPPMP